MLTCPTVEELAKMPPHKRIKWIVLDLWFPLALGLAVVVAAMVEDALSAPNPKQETPLTATESATSAKKPSARCLQATTIQRFSVKPDGKMQYLGGFTMWTKCEK